MALPTPARGRTTKVSLSDSLTKLILAVFLIPAPFEVVTAFAKKESYDFRRLAIVIGSLSVLALCVALMRRRRLYVQSVVGYYLVLAGMAIASFGIFITSRPDVFEQSTTWAPAIDTTLSALTPSVGLLLVAAGAYLIREQVRRTKDELETPGPANISNPRTIKLGNNNASLWKADHFRDRPAADGLVDVCKAQLCTADLHFIAFFTPDNVCLFYIDLLDDDDMAHFDVQDTPGRRHQYESVGRHMRHLATKLDKRFRGLESGRMVRMVLDVEKGALYFYNLKSEGFLVGVTLDQSEVDPTDRKLSQSANDILVYRGGGPDDDFYRK